MALPPANAGTPASAESGGESGGKAAGAYRTIGELSRETGLPQHILRYWETRFPQLRPLQRAGNRRYYRPEDVALVRRIAAMLEQDGYTIRGVQKALMAEGKPVLPRSSTVDGGVRAAVQAVRTALAAALTEDE